MEKDIFSVAIVHEICPICGNKMNESIIMNKRLTEKEANKVKELDGKTIGFSKDACDECLKYKDDVVFCIGIDESKSKINGNKCDIDNMYRTGQIAGLRKDFSLVIDHPEYIIKTANDVSMMFMDKNVGKMIGIFE